MFWNFFKFYIIIYTEYIQFYNNFGKIFYCSLNVRRKRSNGLIKRLNLIRR